MSRLAVQNLSFAYPGWDAVLRGISVAADEPQVIAIAGPNGAGKSTFLDLLSGQRKLQAGLAC